jgi:hypothetical protein
MKKSIINVTEISSILFPVEINIAEINKKLAIEIRQSLEDNFNNFNLRLDVKKLFKF